jgi:FixJ family two-component response regulator
MTSPATPEALPVGEPQSVVFVVDCDAAMRDAMQRLSLREQEVMGFVTAGLMNKQIAGEMQLAEITVKLHRGSVMRKMGAKSLPDLVRMAGIVGIRKKTR